MASLRRTRAGAFGIEDARTLDEILEKAGSGALEGLLLPVDSLFKSRPALTISPSDEGKCRCGAAFPADVPDGDYRVYARSGEFLMLGRARGGVMGTVKSFFAV